MDVGNRGGGYFPVESYDTRQSHPDALAGTSGKTSSISDPHARTVVGVLNDIRQLPLASRPIFLSGFASEPMQSPVDMSNSDRDAWRAMIAETRETIAHDPRLAQDPECLAHLEVAACLTTFPSDPADYAAFEQGLYGRLKSIPPSYWPDILDSAAADHRGLNWLLLEDAMENPPVHLDHVSDRTAVALLGNGQRYIDAALFSTLVERFRITDRQRDQLLFPRMAIKIAAMVMEGPGLRETLDGLGFVDTRLIALIERCLCESAYTRFLTVGDDWSAMATPGRLSDLKAVDLNAWTVTIDKYFRQVEPQAFKSLDESSAAAMDQVLMFAYFDICNDMSEPGHVMSQLSNISTMPFSAQAILTDRWAAMVDRSTNALPEKPSLLEHVRIWREDYAAVSLNRGDPEGAVRAHVAELRAWANGANPADVPSKATEILQRVFASCPVASRGAMFSMLSEFAAADKPLVDSVSLSTWTAEYVMDPQSSMPYASPAFAAHLCNVAGQHFADLPDKADQAPGTRRKLDCFFDRFSIRLEDREALERTVLISMAFGISVDPLYLEGTISKMLTSAGMNTPEAFSLVLRTVRHREALMSQGELIPFA
ncbi:hypothetical protein ACQUFY_17965 [Robbsia andropogonis]|uniref:hypothetical protein n=1 Tax=Robbsia andropogonis TaxID=28092 RepID=UPI003D1A59DD